MRQAIRVSHGRHQTYSRFKKTPYVYVSKKMDWERGTSSMAAQKE